MALILGIETSCDETAAAVVEDGWRVRSNVVATQHDLHARYGGVVPELASRAHLERIGPAVDAAVDEAEVALEDLDAIAVGNRPGLIGSLIVGVSAAKALAWSLNKPLIGVDHVQAHLHAASLRNAPRSDGSRDMDHIAQPPDPASLAHATFPALGLVVSGGHTTLYHMPEPDVLEPIGRTIDDAVGEAYDKAAVILGIGYPGGPNLDKLAQYGNPAAYKLPRSLLKPGSLDFSYSGLKTALLYTVRGHPQGRGPDATFLRSADDLSDAERADLAASFQAAAIDVLITKIRRALDQCTEVGRPVRSLIIGGGVSANSRLRSRARDLAAKRDLPLHLPALAYCVDNAAMIAGHAHRRLERDDVDDLDLPALATAKR